MNIFFQIRQALGYTQEELAKEIDVSFATVNRWENLKTMPSQKAQEKLLNLCNNKGINIVSIFLDKIEEASNEILKKNPGCKVLYHGSKSGIVRPIQPKSRDVCDFGSGFYMGTDPKQPLTLICDFEEAKFYILSVNVEELKTHVFAPDLDWALFVAFNRRKMDSIVDTPLYNKYKAIGIDKDIIVGSIANDRMFFVMDSFFNGNITDMALKESLHALNLGFQYVAKTKDACARIKIEKEISLPWIVRQAFKTVSNENRENGIRYATEVCKKYRRNGFYFDEILSNCLGV